jgi:phage tail-like protein
MAREDPYRNFRFRVDIDGVAAAHFSEVAIGETTTEAIDYREGPEPTHVRKLPGMTKYGNITLKRGVTENQVIWQWHKDIVDGKIGEKRKTIALTLIDEAGQDKARFVVSEAWPTKYDPSDLNAKGNEVFIEVLELVNEGIERRA